MRYCVGGLLLSVSVFFPQPAACVSRDRLHDAAIRAVHGQTAAVALSAPSDWHVSIGDYLLAPASTRRLDSAALSDAPLGQSHFRLELVNDANPSAVVGEIAPGLQRQVPELEVLQLWRARLESVMRMIPEPSSSNSDRYERLKGIVAAAITDWEGPQAVIFEPIPWSIGYTNIRPHVPNRLMAISVTPRIVPRQWKLGDLIEVGGYTGQYVDSDGSQGGTIYFEPLSTTRWPVKIELPYGYALPAKLDPEIRISNFARNNKFPAGIRIKIDNSEFTVVSHDPDRRLLVLKK